MKVQIDIIQNIQMSPILQTSFLVGTFFAVSYNKTARATFPIWNSIPIGILEKLLKNSYAINFPIGKIN